jgi:ribosome modulation factor
MNILFFDSLAIYFVGHAICFGITHFVATRYKTYTFPNIFIGFLASWITLPVVGSLTLKTPLTFVGSRYFYLASFLFSACALVVLGKKVDPKLAAAKKLTKETMNRIAQEGYAAYVAGASKDSNPYRELQKEIENSDNIGYWDRGYALAENRGNQHK